MVESEKIDYAKLGMKAGLEIHQQLDVGSKLFCRCPAFLRSDEPDFSVRRKLHRVAGESGEVDVAVEYEAGLKKDFAYQGHRDTICLIELDEEPCKMLDEKALEEAMKIALLLNCEIYHTAQIMRKMVIDGSNTSGFQRTVLVGHSGFLECSFGKVGIDSVALEEDSCRPVESGEKRVVWNLDRLGIPLVEIGTAPDLKTPEQIKECALKLGEILRACKVKRGIGTIRQDLNISVRGHDRVEVKGFQEPKMMIVTVDKEIERQLEDIKNKKTAGEVRGALSDGATKFNRPMPGRARMYPETDLPILHLSRDKIDGIKKRLPKLLGDIRNELKKKGINPELIELLVERHDEFNTLMQVYDKDANLVAKMVILWIAEIANKSGKSEEEVRGRLTEAVLEKILEAVASGKISAGDVRGVMIKIGNGVGVDEALKVEKADDSAIEQEIMKIVKEKPGLRANAYMGLVIAKFGASVDKRKAMEILNRVVK